MRVNRFLLKTGMAAMLSAGAISGHAADGAPSGTFYDPSNAASPTGKTTGYELFRTIGCPGRQLLDRPCEVPPQDSDGDGVVDAKDKCPNTPAGRKVDADGCELDRDGDGVVDDDDKCPDTPANTPDGCPPVAEAAPAAPVEPAAVAPAATPAPAPQVVVLEDVNFEFDKATLRPEAYQTLDQAVETLKGWGEGTVEIGGHADSRGSDAYNMELSLRRAESVRDYLVSKGIPAERLVTKAYGESQPIADNNTDIGRFKNRRVELQPQK
jgi:OOP family OmpA-OmpF porin